MSKKGDIILGLVMFCVNLIWAVYQQWEVSDLLWGLWISSLLLGYGYIFISMFSSLFSMNRPALVLEEDRRTDVLAPGIAFNLLLFLVVFFSSGFSRYSLIMFIILISSVLVSLNAETKKKLRLDFIPNFPLAVSLFLLSIPMALFMLSFFTVHFVGFHLAYSMAINEYFPIVRRPEFQDFTDFLDWVKNILQITISRYWVFISFSALSRLRLYGNASASGGSSFFMPYKNVFRMHATIFLIVLLDIYQASHYLLYAVFIIYFLPVADIFRLVFPKKSTAKLIPQRSSLIKTAEYLLHTFRKMIIK
jgi:hypothetical protein